MLTFDKNPLRVPTPEDLDQILGPGLANEIEVGETMNCKVWAIRSRGVVELRSITSGSVITTFRPGDGDLLTPRLRDAAIQALRLKTKSDATE